MAYCGTQARSAVTAVEAPSAAPQPMPESLRADA